MITHSTSMPEMRQSSGETSSDPEHQSMRCLGLVTRENGQRHLESVPVVMFADSVNIHQIEQPTYEENEKRWYTNGEYFYFKKDAMNTVRRMNTCVIKDSDTMSTRGLEIVEHEAIRKRKEVIESAVRAVLDIKGAHPEEIAEIYRNITSRSVEKSIATAANDAKDAEDILKDVRKDLNKSRQGKREGKHARNVVPLLSWLVKRRTKRESLSQRCS